MSIKKRIERIKRMIMHSLAVILRGKYTEKYARAIGVKMGKECHFVDIPAFGTEPWLIEIGNHVLVSFDVVFVNHEGAHWVLKKLPKYKDMHLFSYGKIIIEDNVYIGEGVTILKNVRIGKNTIIGAKSLVNKNCEENAVYAGVPARRLCSVEEWAERFAGNMPDVDWDHYYRDKKSEVLRILGESEEKL